jgi:flagella basal body P-ring formation protein FlgA
MLSTLLLSGITVVLAPAAKVEGLGVELGEIAEVRTTDADLKAQLEAYDLGGAPSAGHARLLLAARIQGDLARDYPQHRFTFSGAGAVRVEPLLRHVSGAQVESAARTAIQEAAVGRDLQITLAELPQGAAVSAGSQWPVLRGSLAPTALRTGRVSVPVEVLVGERLARTVWVPFDVVEFERVAVLRRSVQPGETLHSGLFQIERRVRGRSQAAALTPEELTGSVATRALIAGQTVSTGDARKVVLVEAGTRVRLEVRRGAVAVRTMAVVQSSGGYGQSVRVLPDTGERELFATVRGRGLVVLDLDPVAPTR